MGRRKRSAFLPAASHSEREPAIARRVGWTDLPSDLPLCVWSVAPPVSETPGGAFVWLRNAGRQSALSNRTR